MAVDRMGKQMYPGMLSEADEDYIPDPSHLFPIVMLKKLTGKEISDALEGIYPVPSVEADGIRLDNNGSAIFTDASATLIVASKASALIQDDNPDDPFIVGIDSDDELPDLSNITTDEDIKIKKNDKILDKKQSKEEGPIASNLKADDVKEHEKETVENMSNENVVTTQSTKAKYQDKNIEKDRKCGKKVDPRKENTKENMESKTQSVLLDNDIQSDDIRKSNTIESENEDIDISSTSEKCSLSSSKSSSSSKNTKDNLKSNPEPKSSVESNQNELSSAEPSSRELKDKENVPSSNNSKKCDSSNSDKNISNNEKNTDNTSSSKDLSKSKSLSSKKSSKSTQESEKVKCNQMESEEPKPDIPSSKTDSSIKQINKQKAYTLDSNLKQSDVNKSMANKITDNSSTSEEKENVSKSTSSKKSSKSSKESEKVKSDSVQSEEVIPALVPLNTDSSIKQNEKEKSPSPDTQEMSDLSQLKVNASVNAKDGSSISKGPTTNSESTESSAKSSVVNSITELKDIEKTPCLDKVISDNESRYISNTDSSISKDLPSIRSKLTSSKMSTKSSNKIKISDKSLENICDSDSSSNSTKSSKSLTKAATEISRLINFTPTPPAEAKINLLPFLAKTREVKKKKAISKEQKVLNNNIQFDIPVYIKTEPEDITDEGDSGVAFETPLLNSEKDSLSMEPSIKTQLSNERAVSPQPTSMSCSLPDDGEFNSQIDSDQETVDFGETQEKINEDENGSENNSLKEGKEKSSNKIEKKRSYSTDNEDRNNLINDYQNNEGNEKETSRKKGVEKNSVENDKISDTFVHNDNNKRKRSQDKGVEKTDSREAEINDDLDRIGKILSSKNQEIINRSKRNIEEVNMMESNKSRKEENEITNYQDENKRSSKEYDKEDHKRKRDRSNSMQDKKKLKVNCDKKEIEADKNKSSNVDLTSQIISTPSNQNKKSDIESKTTLEESKGIKQNEDSQSVSEPASKNAPPSVGVSTQEVSQPAGAPPTTISKPSFTNPTETIAQRNPMTQPSITQAEVDGKEKSALVSFSASQSKEERIKVLKKIAGMCKSIMKKHSSEEKFQNECEEIKRKVMLVESQIVDIHAEEERRMAELDILQTQLDDLDDEDKIAEYAEKMIDLTDCSEIRDRKINLEKEKRKLVSEQDLSENKLKKAKQERKREELEMASLKASLSSSSRSCGSSISPGPELDDSNNSKQICVSSAPFNRSENNQVALQSRSSSRSDLQQRQILPSSSSSSEQYQHSHIRPDQSQDGVVATLGDKMLYQSQSGPSCNEDMVLIPKSKFDLMQKDEMQRSMQTPVRRQTFQRQETIIKTYQTDIGSMGTIQQQQQQMMAMQQQGQGLIHQQQDITQQSMVQTSPSRSIVSQQTTLMPAAAPQQQVAHGFSVQQNAIMVPQRSQDQMVDQISMMSQQKNQTASINKPGPAAVYQPQMLQTEPAYQHQQTTSSSNNQPTVTKQFSGQDIGKYAKESSQQPMKPLEQSRISTSQLVTPDQTQVSNQHMIPLGRTSISSPEHVMMPGQANMPSQQHVMASSQTRMPSPQNVMMPAQTFVSNPHHVMSSGQTRISNPQQMVMPSQHNVSNPQPSGQSRMPNPHHVWSPGQTNVSSPQNMIPLGQARMTSSHHMMPSGQGRMADPQLTVSSGQVMMTNPQHVIVSGQSGMSDAHQMISSSQVRMSSPQQMTPSSQSRALSSQHVMIQGQARITGPKNVMSVQSRTPSWQPSVSSSLNPPPPYNEALTQVASAGSSHSPVSQHQNKASNRISSDSMLSQMLQTTKSTTAAKPSKHEPVNKKPGSHNHLQVQALQTQQTIMNEQRQKRLMSQQWKADNNSSAHSSSKCPTPGCDGKGNTDPRRFYHISGAKCPMAANSKNLKSPENVSNVASVPCTSSSSSFAESMMMAPNQNMSEFNMGDSSTPPQPTCFLCGKHGEFTCCGDTIYCGVDCQEADFDRHQVICKNVNEDY